MMKEQEMRKNRKQADMKKNEIEHLEIFLKDCNSH